MRFKGFEGEWETKRLKDLGSFFSGGTPKTTNRSYYTGHISFIRSGEINSDVTELRISEEGLKNSSAKMVDKGEILIALYGATSGEIAISKIYGAINQAILCFDTRENKQFFKNLWGKHKDDVLKTYLQGGQGNLSAEIIKQLKFHFPLKEEQNKIASFCELIEERIQTQSKIIQRLETSMQNLRTRLFTQKVRFKDNFVKPFIDWEIKKLGDIATRITNKNKENNTNVLTISAQHGLISQLDFFNNSVSAKDLTGYFLLSKNYFAYNKSYSNGYPMGAIKRLKYYEKGVVSTLYICFDFNSDIDLDFMEHLFEAGIQNSELEKVAQEGARNHGLLNIGLADFFNIELTLPSLDEQKCIGKFLSKFQEKIQLEKQLLLKCENQKKYLLQNLFI